MSAKNDSHDARATPCQESLARRGRDGLTTAQDDSTDESTNNQPNGEPPHGHVSHGPARFLAWIGQRRDRIDGFDPAIDELGDLWDEWRERNGLGEQTTFDSAGWDE